MSLLHTESPAAIRGEVDLFSLPATDTTCDYSMYAEYQPVVNIQDSNSRIDFKIISNSQHYLDLHDSFMYLKVKITNKDGTNLEDDANVSTANCFFHALFSQLDVYFNSHLVSTSNNAYPYRAYLETLLSYGSDYKHSQGGCFLFYPDTKNVNDDSNNGYKMRKTFIAKSGNVEMIDKLRFDLATQHRYILNDINVTISLTKSSDSFSLIGGAGSEYKVKILRASFFLRKQILYPSIILAHQKLLERGEVAKYPYKKTDVKYFTIPQGNSSAVEENIFASSIPSRIILGFVSSAAFNGEITRNPFVFGHTDVTNVGLSINNVAIPIHPLQLNFGAGEYLLAYYMLFTACGIAGQDNGLHFDREQYKDLYALFSFDIIQAVNNNSLLSLDKTGNVKLEFKFNKPLTEATHCIIYSEHQGLLEVDKYRQVVTT